MMALKPLKENEVVIRLPKELIFNVDAAEKSELGPYFKKLREEGIELDEDTILILFTVHQKFHSKNSFWEPYLSLLPESLPMGLFFSAGEFLFLDGTTLLYDIIDVKDNVRQSHERLFPLLTEKFPEIFPEEVFNYENFLWARAMFDSRGFRIKIHGKEKNCLLPFVDLLNSSSYPTLDGN